MPCQNLELVDVAGWRTDDYFATYPEGARDKRAFFPPDDCSLPFINKSRRYLFKLSNKRYPEQFWCEIVAFHVGAMIGVPVPPAYPAINSSNNESAALIEWFYEDGLQSSILGGRFMQQLIPGFNMKTGQEHNFKTIRVLFGAFQRANLLVDSNWLQAWAKGLIFDSLIGNTDRHQNNWGFLFDPSKAEAGAMIAPWFDNGTSLGCDRFEHKVSRWPEDHFTQYLYNGQHHMRWSKTKAGRVGMFEMPKLLIELDPSLRDPMLKCIQAVDLPKLANFLDECTAIQSYVPLSIWRSKFMYRLIERRKTILAEILS